MFVPLWITIHQRHTLLGSRTCIIKAEHFEIGIRAGKHVKYIFHLFYWKCNSPVRWAAAFYTQFNVSVSLCLVESKLNRFDWLLAVCSTVHSAPTFCAYRSCVSVFFLCFQYVMSNVLSLCHVIWWHRATFSHSFSVSTQHPVCNAYYSALNRIRYCTQWCSKSNFKHFDWHPIK